MLVVAAAGLTGAGRISTRRGPERLKRVEAETSQALPGDRRLSLSLFVVAWACTALLCAFLGEQMRH